MGRPRHHHCNARKRKNREPTTIDHPPPLLPRHLQFFPKLSQVNAPHLPPPHPHPLYRPLSSHLAPPSAAAAAAAAAGVMGRQPSASSHSRSDSVPESIADVELECPFGRIDTLRRSDLRESAYELFFMSCRSSPGFGGRSSLNYYPSHGEGSGGGGDWSPTAAKSAAGTGMMLANSKLKKLLGLKPRRSTLMKTVSHLSGVGSTMPSSPGKVRRPMTSAEIMRQQMQVTEQSDGRLRKTLMRTLVGQVVRRAETIILPLELLRQLKPSEFGDSHQYHQWQRRQLKILEAGLLLHPSIPVDKFNSAAVRLKDVIRASETKAIDTSKNSEIMRALSDSVVALAWRSPQGAAGAPVETCHWADGYPMNLLLYLTLLESIFDLREVTVVLDEVDELIELMKKTWSTLGLNRPIHNVCFAWIMFRQYVETYQVEPDLLFATLALLAEVSNDARKVDLQRDQNYVKILSSAMSAMQNWAEKRLLDYHESFDKDSLSNMESILSLALSTSKIINEDLRARRSDSEERDESISLSLAANRVDFYIRSSMRNAFNKVLENGSQPHEQSMIMEVEEDPSKALVQLAKDAEDLILIEKEMFSPVLQNWHQLPTSVAAVTIHNCFGLALKQYLEKVTNLTNELVRVLQSAGKFEKFLVQMIVEDSAESEDGGKGIVREMIPYEVENIVVDLIKKWIDERLRIAKECLLRGKETESWLPRSKSEPFAQSVVDLMKIAKVTVDEFFEIPVGARDSMIQVLSDGLEIIFQDCINFVAQCGSKQTYIPSLPPLTRCNQESKYAKLWKKATFKRPTGCAKPKDGENNGSSQTRPSTSRGTQRIYVRLNTLHYILSHLQALDKSLSFFARGNPSPSSSGHFSSSHRRLRPSYYFEAARSNAQTAIQYVSEVSAYRLIFRDSRHAFYDGLYMGDMAEARVRPALRVLKQNLTLLVSILTDRAQPLAVREVMKASFEALLMVLLAGGSQRTFARADHVKIEEDFKSLKRVFCTSGEGLVAEDVVDREAEVVEGVVALMGQSTERLVDDFCTAACESSGLGELAGGGEGRKVPMPPTTGRWNRTDPNTILRVLCYRNDEAANQFLKKTFQLPKRR